MADKVKNESTVRCMAVVSEIKVVKLGERFSLAYDFWRQEPQLASCSGLYILDPLTNFVSVVFKHLLAQ
jgi:hypothetical protein